MSDKADNCWIVSRSALVSWCAGRVEITSSISGATIRTDHLGLLHVIHAFARARPIGDVVRELGEYAPEQVSACIDELIDAQILIVASVDDPMTAHRWEQSALAFHRRSRQPVVRTNQLHEVAAVAGPRSANTIPLRPPSHGKSRDLSDVLEKRHSLRAWPKRPITPETFSAFLWMSARNRNFGFDEFGQGYVNRPYPSGGAAYSLELYPVIAPGAVESMPAGVYRYLPDSHALETLSQEATIHVPFLEAAGRSAASAPPPIVIVISSRFARQSEVYGSLAYSLVLKEVGALFQTFYLVAEYLDLAACALGGGIQDDLFSRVRNIEELSEPVVGEFMIGPR